MSRGARTLGLLLAVVAATTALARPPEPDETATPPAPASALIVVVTGAGDPAPAAGATVIVRTADGDERRATTDDDGVASFDGLPHGETEVHVEADRALPATRSIVLSDERHELSVGLEAATGRLVITVVGPDDDGATAPVAGCRVSLRRADGEGSSLPATADDGVAVAAELETGTWTVTAIAAGWATAVETVAVEPGETAVEIRLERQAPP